ncbi:MAG TPA: hypothetical protein PJ999_15115, partial [Paracoccus sp. (in: a-proteobacteria)]|nr:hypothetical protein [Paracoccus sp. (in: a-proteobacteria)]
MGTASAYRRLQRVVTDGSCELTLFARLHRTRASRTFRGRLWSGCADGPILAFAAKRLRGEWLIVVSNLPPRRALRA